MTTVDRRSVLIGALAGVCAGAGAGIATERLSNANVARPELLSSPPPTSDALGRRYFAQQGEDVVIENIFGWLGIPTPTYLDIGAWEPIKGSNTYLLYVDGCQGVLVEPNPARTPKLREVRPRDTVLEIGIGGAVEDQEADYYLIKGDGQLNTFSKDEVAELGEASVVGVIKRKLVNINKVIEEHFPQGAPDLLSIDTEGLDLSILRALDFTRHRPHVVCAETREVDFGINQDILDLMRSKSYAVRGGSLINTVFIDTVYAADRVRQAHAIGDAGAR